MAEHSDPVSNLDHDDISSLLNTLLQNSSQVSDSGNLNQSFYNPVRFPVVESSSRLNFPFDSSGLADRGRSSVPSPIPLAVEAIADGDCCSEDEEQVRRGAPGKSSSKRSRAAEVHNLSEKRRRQKINEKMKALQKLIPNSNKTDKASMLDEAIEYLKQLQLQVQMLTMRNGSSLHPFYMPGVAQSLHLPPVASLFEEGNSSRIGSFPANQETSTQAMLDLSTKTALADYKLHSTRMPENSNSRTTYNAQEPSSNLHYRPFNATMLSKVLCKDSLLETNRCGQSSSSGISS